MGRSLGVLPRLALMALPVVGGPVFAQTPGKPEAKTHQIRIEYAAPKAKKLVSTYKDAIERRLLEKFQEFLNPLKLPEPLLLRLQDCDGVSNAWYEDQVVTVCYQYIADLAKKAPRGGTPRGVSRQDAIAAPVVEVFLHEIGHAVFRMLDIPVFGREEDAADQFAAYIMLNLGKIATSQDARRTLGGVVLMYLRDAEDERKEAKRRGMKAFASEHGLAAQRFYNLLCMGYGAYPDAFQMAVDRGRLPKKRAERCADEYRRVTHAMKVLIIPHFDAILLEELKQRQWLEPAASAR